MTEAFASDEENVDVGVPAVACIDSNKKGAIGTPAVTVFRSDAAEADSVWNLDSAWCLVFNERLMAETRSSRRCKHSFAHHDGPRGRLRLDQLRLYIYGVEGCFDVRCFP